MHNRFLFTTVPKSRWETLTDWLKGRGWSKTKGVYIALRPEDPAYPTAPYGVDFVYHPDVLRLLVKTPDKLPNTDSGGKSDRRAGKELVETPQALGIMKLIHVICIIAGLALVARADEGYSQTGQYDQGYVSGYHGGYAGSYYTASDGGRTRMRCLENTGSAVELRSPLNVIVLTPEIKFENIRR